MAQGMNPEEKRRLAALLRGQRWAALATARDNEPLAHLGWRWRPKIDLGGFPPHLSRLALHTRYL